MESFLGYYRDERGTVLLYATLFIAILDDVLAVRNKTIDWEGGVVGENLLMKLLYKCLILYMPI